MNYKDIIKSRETRIAILKALSFVPSEVMVKLQYRIHNGFKLDIKEPKRYTEKLQWYKLFYHDPVMRQCVDKYEVRNYIKSKGLEKILIPEAFVFDSPYDIVWEELPDRFVLKLTSGGGGLNCFFCEDKKQINEKKIIMLLEEWISKADEVSVSREWAYNHIKPRIICERMLSTTNQNGQGLDDYKFFCFNGKTYLKWIDYDRFVGHKRVLYNGEGKRLDVRCTYDNPKDFNYPKEAFETMQPIVDVLSKDFPHVRVDLYYAEGQVYFGELTFYSGSGYELFDPDEFDYILGKEWDLPSKLL